MSANCTNAPDAVPSDAGVAGIGVLLSFIVTAAISLVISASLIFQETRRKTTSSSTSSSQKPSVLRRKLLNSYSDQQILTGIGIQSVGLAKTTTMVPYHFFLIWMLSLLSMAVHNATLLALARDFRRDWVLRWMRQLLMLVNLVLSSVYGIYIFRSVQDNLSDRTFPIACACYPQGERLRSRSMRCAWHRGWRLRQYSWSGCWTFCRILATASRHVHGPPLVLLLVQGVLVVLARVHALRG
ncbi:hypothetical protein K449DRAFT_453762 [Hypoxylon sp. EC38]|nr:hypothetical protein K449DRAFT_453762 [Hypoxylon sp. EC38]